MAEGYVQVSPDSSGKKVDTAELVRVAPDSTGTPVTIERQRVSIASDNDPVISLSISPEGRAAVDVNFSEVVIQLKRIAMLLEILTNTEVNTKDVTNAT